MIYHLSFVGYPNPIKRFFASQDTLKMFILNLWVAHQTQVGLGRLLRGLTIVRINPLLCPNYKNLFTVL